MPADAQKISERMAGYKVLRTLRFADKPLSCYASGNLHKLKVKDAYLAGAY